MTLEESFFSSFKSHSCKLELMSPAQKNPGPKSMQVTCKRAVVSLWLLCTPEAQTVALPGLPLLRGAPALVWFTLKEFER